MSQTLRKFSSQHDDLLHDASYNFYGNRLATCSSDQTIKVWDAVDAPRDGDGDGDDGGSVASSSSLRTAAAAAAPTAGDAWSSERAGWQCTATFKAHNGGVWRVVWAHPEFGQVLASCSFDRTVCLWEEIEDTRGRRTWNHAATLVDSRGALTDIKFAPRHQGLRLATASADGRVRVYEAHDVMNLAHWSFVDDFEGAKGGVTCIAWNPSPLGPAALVVGSNDHAVRVFTYHEAHRKWQPTLLLDGNRKGVCDVSWAPNLGRSYHLIAAAGQDHSVHVWQVASLTADVNVDSGASAGTADAAAVAAAKSTGAALNAAAASSTGGKSGKVQNVRTVLASNEHQNIVWRAEWNVTGTILATSGDDGCVRLWKANYTGQWALFSVVRGGSGGAD